MISLLLTAAVIVALDRSTCTRGTDAPAAIQAALRQLEPVFAEFGMGVRLEQRVVRRAQDGGPRCG